MTRPDQYADPAATIRTGSSSFALASYLLAPPTRLHVRLLYAWCRYCDDVADGQVMGRRRGPSHTSLALIDELREQSLHALDGEPTSGAPFDGLGRIVSETNLPRAYVLDHLMGFQMDAAGHRCQSLGDTLAYSYHVAGVVGLMMAWVMGVTDANTLLRGCDLGIAFQLTNIARDVNDDAVSGRIYLPADWLRQSGVEIQPERPLEQPMRQRLVPVVARLLDEADRYYASAWYGIGQLPARSAWAVTTARHIYADIGEEVRRRRDAAWGERVATTRSRKLQRLVQSMGEATWARATRWTTPPSRDGLWTPVLPPMRS